jgi:hypothetical protein
MMGEREVARLKDQIIQNYQAACQVFNSPARYASHAIITARLASLQNYAVQLAHIVGEHEAHKFLIHIMSDDHTADNSLTTADHSQIQQPFFQPGALIQRASGSNMLYRVTAIQYIEQIPYYHLVSQDKRYLILPHAHIQQWRAAAKSDIAAQETRRQAG